eukprot:TRINITY_DN73353_c0_g1_i1.p1 TRINITY_DN73353_c0_g1~~TRINITY_DN73353_c0_g1_i1.p1  ORF type:complete len:299 (+),score=74.59 TRINITY_DN73353_c0_g1_i1:89-985(+)
MDGSKLPFGSFLYPEPFPPVRNTFLDDPMRRPASLEGFFQERQVFSCPVSRISEPGSGVSDEAGVYLPGAQLKISAHAGSPDGVAEHIHSMAPARVKSLDTDVGSECSTADGGNAGLRTVPATPESDYAQLPLPPALPLPPPPPLIFGFQSAASVQPDALAAAAAAGYMLPPAAAAAAPPGLSAAASAPLQFAASASSQPPVQVLRLEAVLDPPTAGSAPAAASVFSLPSLGSALHSLGQCRPCAFVATKGCSSGMDCQFCHLCDAGEKKRRQKAKRAFYGALSEMTQRIFAPASNGA